MMTQREFTATSAHTYNYTTPNRWLLSHIQRHAWLLILAMLASIGGSVAFSQTSLLVGRAFDQLAQQPPNLNGLMSIALVIAGLRFFQGLISLSRHVTSESLSQLLQRDIRDELYLSLLGKSQTFHNRQRVGDIMARATSDVQQIGGMINPGFSQIFLALVYVVVALSSIAALNIALLLTPLIFGLIFPPLINRFGKRLSPVVAQGRAQFGQMNAALVEALNGIEVIKGHAQEQAEQQRFETNAQSYRNLENKRGAIQASYLPLLLLALFYALGFGHALYLWQLKIISIGQVVAFIGLFDLLRLPTNLSLTAFTMIQLGLAGAKRIHALITTETELDENAQGHRQAISGSVVFEHVSFVYDGQTVLNDISFSALPGQTVAIVGQTGSGKSTLTKLVNRTYDASAGRVLIDGVDVRNWNLQSLRSQISMIEQDIFLFSRNIAENIGFGAGGQASPEQVEHAAHQAQAHEFISALPQGYQTVIGQRGVTLSGGQRQRIAIARAFLTDPRILVLDDSTSAIDSATEDQIQQAMRRVFQGRTTLLITHRLSQIRLADWILLLHQGRLVDQGTHSDLLGRNETYRSLFVSSLGEPEPAVPLPPAEQPASPAPSPV